MIPLSINWKNLALSEAQTQGVDSTIVLATVDAETGGRNILGDNGNALGYGQVWPSQWPQAFEYAAKRFQVDLPATLYGKQQLTLSNDAFSMAVAVYVIKSVWNSSGKNFRQFSLHYVGPAIPDSDYQRRYKIYLQYQGGGFPDYTGSGNGGSSASSYSTGSSYSDIMIPATDYGIVAGSQRVSDNILYGRRYRVLISNSAGVALDVSQLRCTFNVQKTILQQPNYSEVVIYNLSADTENTLIQEGNRIVIEAGYEGEQYGLIFDGDIVQPVRDKEDGVTYRLLLYSLDGDRAYNQGFVGFSLLKGQTARSLIGSLASKASVPSELGNISDSFDKTELSRGKVVFGLARDYYRQLAQSQSAAFYLEDGKVNIIKATDLPEGEILDLSPSAGLIGVPAQTEYGVSFRCLLNPRIRINTLVHIDNSLIRAQTYQQGQVIRNLDNDGIYRVISVTHKGDTRGDDWYTECETVSQAGLMPGMMSTTSSNPW